MIHSAVQAVSQFEFMPHATRPSCLMRLATPQHVVCRSGSCRRRATIAQATSCREPATHHVLLPRPVISVASPWVQQRCRRRRWCRGTVATFASASPLAALASPDLLFSIATFVVVPVYILMLAAPRWPPVRNLSSPPIALRAPRDDGPTSIAAAPQTRAIVESPAIYVGLGE